MNKKSHKILLLVFIFSLTGCKDSSPISPQFGENVPPNTKPIAQTQGLTRRLFIVASVQEDNTPVSNVELAFSQSISGQAMEYQWAGITNAHGQVEIEILTEINASGYFAAKAQDLQSGVELARWHSIPLNSGQTHQLNLSIGKPAEVVSSVYLNSPTPKPAVQALIDAFDQYLIVAWGERHGLLEQQEIIFELIRHPDFQSKVNDIVIELGNAQYQDILDRYVSGDNVPMTEVQQVWRNATPTFATSLYPFYKRLITTVREINQTLPLGRRLRVLAGDPPIDWDEIQTTQDALNSILFVPDARDIHYARVVREEVLNKGRRALIYMGQGHMGRNRAFGQDLIERIDPNPETVLIVLPYTGLGVRYTPLASSLNPWPKPSVASIRNTWIGTLDAQTVIAADENLFQDAEGNFVSLYDNKRLENVFDALLYLGSPNTLTYASPDDVELDPAYQQELLRRISLLPMIFGGDGNGHSDPNGTSDPPPGPSIPGGIPFPEPPPDASHTDKPL